MKKKVFSLMMTLLLAFVGVAKADVVELGGGSTTTNSYLPTYEFYNYSLTQQIYTADEIGTAGTINSIAFYTAASATRTLQVYLVHTTKTAFSSTTDWEIPTSADMVYSGSVTYTAGGWNTLTLTTPFEYNGTDNLCLIVDDNTGSYVSSVSKYVYNASGNQTLRIYSDGTNYDALAPTSYTGTQMTQKNCLQIDITAAGGGGGGFEDKLHVKYVNADGDEVIDSLNLGVRPVGAWMEPFEFTMYSEGPTYNVTVLDFTPSDGMFSVEGEELPFQVTRTADVDLLMATNATTAGVVERQFVAITEGNRAAHIWPVIVEMYTPLEPDVVEEAHDFGSVNAGFSDVNHPASDYAATELHNDYTLPFPEIPEGVDAVYKLTFPQDVMLTAYVSDGEDGKVALYTEDFYGEGGPMADNYYTGPTASAGGSGGSGAGFEAMIGDETSTTSLTYFPFHTLWNYSIAENLFLASELTAAGVTTAPMTSLSWNVLSMTCDEPQNGISIWMANVSDSELTGTSHLTSGMTLVYTGTNVLPVVGWNEFVFNAGSFAWDGHSNVLIVCQRLNGTWDGSISWQTHNPGFTATSYDYDDYEVYNMTTQTYSMYTSATNRANIVMKSDRRAEDPYSYLSVYPGSDYNEYLPLYGYYADSDQCGQYIIPAGDLAAMNGGTIYRLTYVLDTPAADLWGATFKVYMKEVSYTTPTELVPRSQCTLVYTGELDGTGATMYFDLDTPYTYNGGNLLIGFDIDPGDEGEYYKTYFQGCNTSYVAGLTAYSWGELNYGDEWDYEQNFIPTTNFRYMPGAGGGGGGTPVLPEGIAYGPIISNAAVEAGTYYLVASSTTPDFEVTINAETMPCPAVEAEGFAFNPTPADDADGIEPGSVTLRWNVPSYATGWRLVFGSTYYPDPTHPQTIMYPEDGTFSEELANSFTVTNLWNNTNYFWHVEFNNDGCPDGVSSPIWGFTTHLNIPTNLQANDYTIFEDETVTLTWNAVVDRTFRTYFIYRDGVKVGETTTNSIGNTTFTDGPLEYNMGGYVYYVTAIYDEGESAPSDPITVKVSGYTNNTGINGYAWEQDGTTGIPGVLVTLTGTDEFGDPHTYTATTDNNGYYSKRVYAGEYTNAVATKDGYQETVTVHPLPFTVAHNAQENDVNFIIDENFDPVCSVIAEYYPDSLDPNSPYVKVYWGCGLPGEEIIEDFETGDFSKFDWQLDPTYPWSITTNNPYEGTYCMKSGGAGVASVVSNMTVTVNIPADGLMSFFAKISCENSWDYGYFYIDGVQKGSFTGAGNWIEKTYDVTAGDHTFQWRYTKDSSVNSNDDCFYVDYINFYKQPEPAVPGMTYDFEDGTMQGWTSVDADGDGYGWYMGSEIMTGQTGNNGSADFVLSQSYYMGEVLYPDNYLVSPQVQLGGIVRFYACAQDASYAAEHFGLAVSTTNTNPSSFTMVQEWTMTAKSAGEPTGKPIKGQRSGREQGNWYEYTVDLSAYSGMGYVAIRHFNCSDMFYLNVDDITIGEPGKGIAENRSLHHYRVYRTNCYNDGPYTEENTVLLASVWVPDTVYIDVEWADLEPGVYKWGVGAVYSGNRGEEIEGPISWAEPMQVGGNRDELTYDFDDSSLQGWTTIDGGTPTGYGWHVGSTTLGTGYGHNSSTDLVISQSYDNNYGIVYPDNYLISPQVALGGSISFYACAQDASYAAEHFGVAVSTTGTNASDFTMLQEWTIGAKGTRYEGDRGNRDQSAWTLYTVDLSAYAGQTGYVAIRHFNCSDQYFLDVDDITISTSGTPGPGPGPTPTPTPGTNLNELALPRESETIWSNCLDKDMYLDHVSVNVLLNSADSPEGTTVTLTNYNEYEQQTYGGYNVTLDGSGYYEWTNFRKGEYMVKVEHVGYEPIVDSVSIWETTDLRYVLIEIIYGVENLYVSRTGWAMWDPLDPQISGDRHLEYYKVMCTSIDGVPIFNYNTTHPFCQLSTDEPYNAPLVEGEHYLCKVACMYSTGMGEWCEPVEWEYEPCDHWGPVDEVTVDVNGQGNHVEWVFEHGFNPYDPGTGGGGTGTGETSFTEDFEGGLNGWNVLTINSDGGSWIHSDNNLGGYDYTTHAHGGTGFAMCYSFVDYVGAFDTDSYMYTPQKYDIVNGSTLTFWADNANDSYPESFSVCVATADNPTAADFTQVWSGSAKGGAAKANNRHDANRYDNWRSHSIDLSAYAGQSVYIAFHDVNYDMYEIWIDDVALTAPAKGYNAMNSGMVGGVYAFNITDIANYDERVYFLYNLVNDDRFDVIQGEAAGMFIISATSASLDLEEAVNEFVYNNNIEFSQMDKVQAADVANAYKSSLPAGFVNSLMMDMYIQSRENNMCEFADPFCTDNGMYEFPAGVNAGSGEAGPDYDCLYTTPNPAWYYMRIGDPGAMNIHMYSTPQVDIDFCCWGPFDDPTTPCPYGLTEDKVVSCSYSTSWTENCMIPATAQTGEYYILVITNYSNQTCNINFSMIEGNGSTDCGILPPVDIIGFLITMDNGEFVAFAGPTDREYTHEGEFGDHEYCVRPIYPGEMVLPDHNYGWSMGCPVCSEGQGTCAPGAPIHAELMPGNDDIKVWWGDQNPGPGPGGCEGDEFTVNFDGGMPAGWTTIDADNDGYDWVLGSACDGIYLDGGNLAGAGHNASQDLIVSGSYSNVVGPLTPDNWLVSPEVTLCEGSTFSFWACAQDASYAAEHFGVAVSDEDGQFVMVQEWTMTAKGTGATSYGRNGELRAQGTWRQYTVDLGDHAGEGRYVAIRHFNCTDMFMLDVDDIELSNGAKGMRAGIEKYNVYRSTEANGEYTMIGSVVEDGSGYYEYIDSPATAGTYYYQVRAEYADCESEPAQAADDPTVNYVSATTDGIGENDGNVALYPNPTKGNVTIEAAGMSRITVVSVLGQVVFDTELDADNYTLNMSQFNAGMYMVRVYTESGMTVKRVTVMQ